jgi:hypothetical protein
MVWKVGYELSVSGANLREGLGVITFLKKFFKIALPFR